MPVDPLGGEVSPRVRLVPHLPVPHPRQGLGLTRGSERPAVAPRSHFREPRELRRRGPRPGQADRLTSRPLRRVSDVQDRREPAARDVSDLTVNRSPVVRRIVRIRWVRRRCGLDGVPEEENACHSRAGRSGTNDRLVRVRARRMHRDPGSRSSTDRRPQRSRPPRGREPSRGSLRDARTAQCTDGGGCFVRLSDTEVTARIVRADDVAVPKLAILIEAALEAPEARDAAASRAGSPLGSRRGGYSCRRSCGGTSGVGRDCEADAGATPPNPMLGVQ